MLFFLALRLVLPDSDDTFARGSLIKFLEKCVTFRAVLHI